jgi:hypothetical protein
MTTHQSLHSTEEEKKCEQIPQNIKKFVLNVAGTAHTAV